MFIQVYMNVSIIFIAFINLFLYIIAYYVYCHDIRQYILPKNLSIQNVNIVKLYILTEASLKPFGNLKIKAIIPSYKLNPLLWGQM